LLTVCQKRLSFGSIFGKHVTADFNAGSIASNVGGLLLREHDERCRREIWRRIFARIEELCGSGMVSVQILAQKYQMELYMYVKLN
jgi:hypothetical protein